MDNDEDNKTILFDHYFTNNTIHNKMSHFYKLHNGLETVIKKKYFVAFIIATSKVCNSNQINVLLQSYGQHAG